MDIQTAATEAGCTYYLKGRFDAHQVPRFKEAVKPDESNLTLDFSDLSFIDSTGLATLVSLYKQSLAQDSSFRIVNVQDQVWVIFEITHLHTVLPIERN